MKKLTTFLCLTLAILLLGTEEVESADFQKGLNAYYKGDGATALREWKPLAKQGHARAQTILGFMYDKGKGVPQNDKTAVRWYRLAAKQGYAPAQTNLGVMYGNGKGVIPDKVRAHMWWIIAASQGHKTARKNRDIVAKRMTFAENFAARRLARKCVRKNFKGC